MEESKRLCMGCMHPLPDGRAECGLCGYPANGENPEEYLAVGTQLSDRYITGRVLSAGSDSATYIGYDTNARSTVIIREFLPATVAHRGKNGEVTPIGGCEGTYAEYLEHFRTHIRTLARLRDLPILVPVFDIFEQNNTAYAVSERVEGTSFNKYLKQKGGLLPWEDARRLFSPQLSSIASCHTAGLYHYGICPENMLIDTEGRLRLMGWSLPQIRTVNTDLKPQLQSGYAAPEQYEFDRACSPATDVYGIAATLFRVLSGNPPPEGSLRSSRGDDLLLPADVAESIPGHVAAALAGGLQVQPDKRTRTVLELRDRLSSSTVISTLAAEGSGGHKKNSNSMRKYFVLFGIAAILIILILAVLLLYNLYPNLFEGKPATSSNPDLPPTTTATTFTQPTQPASGAPNLITMDFFALAVNADGKATFSEYTVEMDGLVYSGLPYGAIVEQTPAAGEEIGMNGTVHVVISAGMRQETVPDLIGWDVEKATLYLKALGFKIKVVEEDIPNTVKGTVIGSWPEVGKAPNPGSGNTVTLRVSKWEADTSTPDGETPDGDGDTGTSSSDDQTETTTTTAPDETE